MPIQSGRLRCPRCGGRLFLESDYLGLRLQYYMGCLNCARQFELSGKLVRGTKAMAAAKVAVLV